MMARATNVYVVIPKGRMTPEAAFTVKHEMETFLEEQAYDVAPRIWRITDGLHSPKVADISGDYYI